jgi:hypothetical protein
MRFFFIMVAVLQAYLFFFSALVAVAPRIAPAGVSAYAVAAITITAAAILRGKAFRFGPGG